MSEQYEHSRCPETGTPFTIYKRNSGKEWGIARRIPESSNYKYLTVDYQWVNSEPSALNCPTKESAEQRVADYIKNVMDSCILPLVIDQTNQRCSFKCPKCGLVHKTQIRADSWDVARQVLRRTCPKTHSDILIKLWEMQGKLKVPMAKVGTIDPLPNWDCTECWATGEYVGFSSVSPCQSCFGKKDMKNYKSGSFP